MPEFLRKYLSELLGTFVLVFVGGLSILSAQEAGDPPLVAVSLGFGLALLAALYAFGEISGGHFNPAVTLAALADNRIGFKDFVAYWVAQVAGGVIAAVLLAWASSTTAVAAMSTVPADNVGFGSAFLLELSLTAVFVMVILKVTTSTEFGGSALVAIPLTYAAIHFAAWPLTGASVNPARTLGTAFVGREGTDILVYLAAPLLGALVGWALHELVTTEEAALPLMREGD